MVYSIYFIIPVIEREKLRDIDRWVFSSTSILVRNSYNILWICVQYASRLFCATVLPQPA